MYVSINKQLISLTKLLRCSSRPSKRRIQRCFLVSNVFVGNIRTLLLTIVSIPLIHTVFRKTQRSFAGVTVSEEGVPSYSALKMVATDSSETLSATYLSTQFLLAEYHNLNIHPHKILSSQKRMQWFVSSRSRWPCGLPRLLGSRVQIPLKAWMFVCCVGSGLCNKLISRSEESYPVCVCVCVWYSNLNSKSVRNVPWRQKKKLLVNT